MEMSVNLFDDVPLEAEAVSRLVCDVNGKTVGFEYLWCTGEKSTLWIGTPCQHAEQFPINRKQPNID
jgi:hypothetical protein